MDEITVIVCSLWLLSIVAVNSVKVNNEKILSDKFINEINSVQSSWLAGRNFNPDSQLRNLLSVNFTRNYDLTHVVTSENFTLPSSFDSRTQWPLCTSIGKMIPQGNCASSFAIVAASIFSDRLCIQKNMTRSSSSDQLLTCCKKCGAGCFGGHIENSFKYMSKVGLVSGGGYRSKLGCRPYRFPNCYDTKSPSCTKFRNKTPSCYIWKCTNGNFKERSYDMDKIKMKQVYAVSRDVNMIKYELVNNGPVSSTFTIYEDFYNYKKGVYYHVKGVKIGILDVKIIGWGKTKESIPYWIVVNSWGKDWGDEGTFKIRLGIDECHIESHILSGSFL